MRERDASSLAAARSDRRRRRDQRAALEGMQIMGGYGYASEYPMERYLRAAVVTTIYGGTSEIQRNIIAKTLGL